MTGQQRSAALSFAQQRLWFLDQLEPGSVEYSVPMAWRLTGAPDVAALRSALARVVARHEVLRTAFAVVDDTPLQVVSAQLPVELPLIEAASPRAVQDALTALASEPFDLQQPPLWRAALIRSGPADHLFALNLHHSVVDGWSTQNLLAELSACYNAALAGTEPELPELPVQYADYAERQRAALRGPELAAHLDHWRAALAGVAPLELPTDRPRLATRSTAGAGLAFTVPDEVTAGLRALARERKTTPFTLLVAAIQLLLGRYTGQHDVAVGTPIANRDSADVEALIGFFVNTLVLRTDLSGDPSFVELLDRVREVTLEAYAHAEVPFDRLVEELQPDRDPGRSPLFQVLVVMNERIDGPVMSGLVVEEHPIEVRGSKFDLTFAMVDEGGALSGELRYSTELFDADRIERTAGHLLTLLAAVAAGPHRRLSELPLLTEREHRRALDEWSGTTAEPLPVAGLHQLVEEQARAFPARTALFDTAGRSLTYGELNARANRLAHRLLARGAGPEQLVAICLPRSLESVVALLAVLKSGAAYLPLDPALPAERLAYTLGDAAARLVLADRSGPALPAEYRERTLYWSDLDWADPAWADPDRVDPAWADSDRPAGCEDDPDVAVDPAGAAYVTYTSGSTGRPKGVVTTHRGAVSHLAFLRTEYRLGPADTALAMAGVGFDASVREVFGALAAGAQLLVTDPDTGRDPERVVQLLVDHQVTVLLSVVPSLMHRLAAVPLPDGRAPRVRLVLSSGERLRSDRLAGCDWLRGTVVNQFGPTETTMTTTRTPAPDRDGWRYGVGRPITNSRIHVLDEALSPCPAGVPGELYIGGAGVARGYLGRPGPTAERFVPDPFGPGRLYRTGDACRWSADGELEYLGRLDHQVKIRGVRVEPGEVEAALRACDGVTDAVVVADADAVGESRLIAYLVAADTAVPGLRATLERTLPAPLVPAVFVTLPALPLTANGKVDRRALPAPDAARPELASAFVAPRSAVEQTVAEVWAEVLGLDQVGVFDDFFALGGHSLLATQLVSRLHRHGLDLPLRAVFEARTVAGLAALTGDAGPVAQVPIGPVARDRELPLSFAQQRLWFLEQLQPGSSDYVINVGWRMTGALDAAALRSALVRVVARHEALRTALVTDGETPRQVVSPTVPVELPVLPFDPAAVEEFATRPFDLRRAPLWRAALFQQAADRHVLVLALHHTIGDAWSAGVLVRELNRCYRAALTGADPALPALPIQYADFAAWQRDWLSGPELERQLAYWRGALASAGTLELATDRPRAQLRSSAGATHRFLVPAPVAERLNELARGQGVTLFMVLLACLQVVLAQHSGQQDIVVGTPIANRNRPELEPLVGFFVNTLVLRTDLSGDPTFAELLDRVREVTLSAYEHQDLPFERLVEELHPQRDLGRNPLFQVMLSVDTTEAVGWELPGVEIEDYPFTGDLAKFDLTATFSEDPDGLHATLRYSTALFDADRMTRLAAQLGTLFGGVRPGSRLSELPVLPADEHRLLVHEHNATAVPYPADRGIHQLVADRARTQPDDLAVSDEDGSRLTFGELNARANRLAHHLRAAGVGPDVIVAVCLPRRADVIVALLAVLKAGGAYLPLDPEHPADRVAFLLTDTAAPVLVTADATAATIPAGYRGRVVNLDRDAFGQYSAADPQLAGHPAQLAYVIYTSGSTGAPKGVQVTQGGLANYLQWAARSYAPDGPVGALLHSPLIFDMSVTSVFLPLLQGRSVHVLPESTGPEDLLAAGTRQRAALLKLTPAHLAILTEAETAAASGIDDASGTEAASSAAPAGPVTHPTALVLGGERLPTALANRAFELLGSLRYLVNEYGPTETVVGCAVHTMRGPRLPADGSVPIGRPIANTRLYVLDAELRVCPVGVPGELYIGGDGVARGYLGRPGLTAERFVPDPFGRGRLYRSGDVCRWSAAGELEYLGRADHQVKIRGYRIEPGEVEARLLARADVAEAVVVAREDLPGDHRLVAYLVARDAAPDTAELRDWLAQALPSYLVPAAFVVLPELPIAASGKVDRAALPAPDTARPDLGARLVAPRTPTERAIAQVWCQVLGLDEVGVHDDFFALGGHSLLATRVVSRLARDHGFEIPLRLLFEAPTVAELAERVRPGEARQPAIGQADRSRPLPLSFGQQRLWFLDQLEPGSAEYLVPLTWRLHGPLDTDALRTALAHLVARHEVLRTALVSTEGRAHQQILPHVPVDLPVLPAADAADTHRQVARLARTPLDLSHAPLWRATLVRESPDEHVLVLVLHHSVADAWSAGVLVRELGAGYRAARTGADPALPALPIQYADYAAWQREWLQGPVLAGQLEYWRQALAALTPLELPTDRPRGATRATDGATVDFTVPDDVADHLRRLAADRRVTLFMVLLGCLQVLLARHSGQDDIVVGTPIAGRNRSESEPLVGFFVNTLVLRTDLSGDPTFGELLDRVREVTLGAYEHQDLPFERLVDELHPERDLSRTPLFQVMLSVDTTETVDWNLPDVHAEEYPLSTATAKFDLTAAFADGPDGLRGILRYSTALFDADRIARMATHLVTLLAAAAADPEVRLSDLPLLPAEERRQVLDGGRQHQPDLPGDATLHQLVEAQARRHPGRPAVSDTTGAALTYGELNRRANRVAHRLRALGVGPDTMVGVAMARTVDTVVALLAVVKAGGAYLPLDPDYPTERTAFLIADAGVQVVITDGTAPVDHPGHTVDLGRDRFEDQPAHDPAPLGGPDHLAYVIYTSGSTGRPKGVLTTHRNAVRLFDATQGDFGFDEEAVWLSTHSYAFDFSVWEIWGALTRGGQSVIASKAVARDPERLAAVVAASRVTMLSQTPTAFQQLMPVLLAAGPAELRYVVFGGEALDLTALRPWFADPRAARVTLVNMYGITETTVHATLLPLDAGTRGDAAASPIGRPLADLRAYVLDAAMALCPIGVPGELYLGGRALARGYLGRPGLTAERFVPDPFGTGRLYRSGDVCRWSATGELEYLGRADHQVKIRGYRIELGEIEARLLALEDVAEAVVLAREDVPGTRRLVAYLVMAGPERPVPVLRAWLEQTLPTYMVPAAFVVLPQLPLTASGKVDRHALPAPDAARPDLGRRFVGPRTPVEQVIATAWCQVLGIERAGVHDNFFDLGGDSILSIQIVARAAANGVHLTPRLVFEHQTIAELATAARTAPAREAEQGTVTGQAPLTPIQHWFFARDLPERQHYNQSVIVTVPDDLTTAEAEALLRDLLRQHDALRMRFHRRADGWVQQNAAEEPGQVLWTADLSADPAGLAEHADRVQAGLDLAGGPVFRALLADLGAAGRRLLLVAHHLVVDGVSWRILLDDLAAGYRRLREGGPAEPPAKTTSFVRWATLLAAYADSPDAREDLLYWQKAVAEPVPLPLDFPDGRNTVASAATEQRELTADRTRTLLTDVPAAYRTRINDVLLTALALTLRDRVTARSMAVDVEGHGREDHLVPGADLSRTVGWFTSIYPVCLGVAPGQGLAEALKETKQTLREVPHDGIGYGILRHLGGAGDTLAGGGDQVLFNYLGQFDNVLSGGRAFGDAAETRGRGQAASGTRSHVLEINSEISGGVLRIRFGYSSALHRRTWAARFADDYLGHLEALIDHCVTPGNSGAVPADFPLAAGLDQETLDAILTEYGRGE
ncbi:amino acid adenylation domain-containing protein [Kitasatospora sp. LaBMicrA B282]|uniref:amino acid adenylation domain-containing protein n=1 Tax=Kitasatospora sp. LaBMicrA B282 TaxID=3420949 RepID=UPI003D0DC0C7